MPQDTKTDKRSLGALLLHGGDWRGIRVMGLGERLAVIGVSAVTALCVSGPASYFLSRGEMRSDPGRRDGDGLVVPEGLGLPADEQPAHLKLDGDDGVRPAELHVPAGVADCREDSVVSSFHAEDSSTTK